jgi:hypothetical protein
MLINRTVGQNHLLFGVVQGQQSSHVPEADIDYILASVSHMFHRKNPANRLTDGFRPIEHVRSSKAGPFPVRSHDDGEDVYFFVDGEQFPSKAAA